MNRSSHPRSPVRRRALHAAALALGTAAVPAAAAATCPSRSGNAHEAERCRELELIAARPGVAARRGSRLVLVLDDGRRTVIADRVPRSGGNETEIALHALVDVLDAPRLFVVMTSFYEGGELSLVSRVTGRRWVVRGDALEVSPDGLRVVSWSARNGYDDGALEIWRVESDRMTAEFRGETSAWWPVAVRWVDGATVSFDRATGDDPDAARIERRRLVRDDASSPPRWRAGPDR
ncbi:MAG: hypothetical protein RJA99_3579 [Pseudomonadota bacterium]|jgi:hypothetical protein